MTEDWRYNFRVVVGLLIFSTIVFLVVSFVIIGRIDHQRVQYNHRTDEICRSLTDFPQPASAYPADDPQAVWLSNMFRTYC